MRNLFLPESVTPEIKAEQVRLLYQQGVAIVALGIVTALISVTMFWSAADHALLLLWFAGMILLSIRRLQLSRHFGRIESSGFDADLWARRYIAGTFLSGALWGSLAFFYDPLWPVEHQVVLFVLFTGIIGGSMNTNSSVFIAFPAFYPPAVICLMYVMFTRQGEVFAELFLLMLIYIVLMYVSAYRFNQRLTQTLKIRFENEQLAKHLTDSNRVLSELAEHDELTELSNRRSMDKYLLQEWERHRLIERHLSLLFIDIDYFKEYNDTYGHAEGDHCLASVARTLRKNIRLSGDDMAARYGGEEFAIILPHTPIEEASLIAERIRQDIESLCIPHQGSNVKACVTLSIGVASLQPHLSGASDSLLKAADQALYKAKQNGRNRVVRYDEMT